MPLLRIAHRGYAAIARENSLEAIAGAVALGADMVEVDVRRRPDGVLVLDHDDARAPQAPTLADALAVLADTGAGVNVDLKEPGVWRETADAVRGAGMLGRATATGTCWHALAQLQHLEPRIRVGLTIPRRGASLPRALRPLAVPALRGRLSIVTPRLLARHGATLVTVYHRLVDAALVDAVHATGGGVWCWTVDDPTEVARLERLGVDGICSDHPASHGLGERIELVV